VNAAGRDQGGKGPAPAAGGPESQALAQEIQQTREQLGETVAGLAAKADVKARATGKAHQLTSQLKARAGQAKERAARQAGGARREPVLLAVAGGAMAVGIVLIVWAIRH
jgi:uncharacterized protein YjbJ (UPF0337 family)